MFVPMARANRERRRRHAAARTATGHTTCESAQHYRVPALARLRRMHCAGPGLTARAHSSSAQRRADRLRQAHPRSATALKLTNAAHAVAAVALLLLLPRPLVDKLRYGFGYARARDWRTSIPSTWHSTGSRMLAPSFSSRADCKPSTSVRSGKRYYMNTDLMRWVSHGQVKFRDLLRDAGIIYPGRERDWANAPQGLACCRRDGHYFAQVLESSENP